MELSITENLKKKDAWFQASLYYPKTRAIIEAWDFRGTNAYSEFEEMISTKFKYDVRTLEICCFTTQPNYVKYFENVEEVRFVCSRIQLDLTSLSTLTQLNSLRINQHSKPCDFIGISHFKNLNELIIGDFSPVAPIPITSLDEVVKCNDLQILMLGNIKMESSEIRKLANLTSLQRLALAQNINVEDLAYLSAKMPDVNSNELKAWQDVPREPGVVKINGKKRPYLKMNIDHLKIESYEKEFNKLKAQFV